jgi:hypothetical protein
VIAVTAQGRLCVGALTTIVVAAALATRWLLASAERDLAGVRPPPAGAFWAGGGSISAPGLTEEGRPAPERGLLFAFARGTRAGQALQAASARAEQPSEPSASAASQARAAGGRSGPELTAEPASGAARNPEPRQPSAPGEPEVYVAGVVEVAGQVRVLLVRRSDGASRWVGEGGFAFGYTVQRADLKGAQISRGGRTWDLRLGAGAPPPSRASAPATSTDGTASGTAPGGAGGIEAKFVGTWMGEADGERLGFEFQAGGRGSMWSPRDPSQREPFRWAVVGDKLRLNGEDDDEPGELADFRFEGDRTLVVTMDGETIRLTKQ